LIKIPSFKKQKYALFLNENAFTLIEALFALSIFTIIVFFMTPIFQVMLKNIDAHASIQEMEWTVFCSQIKKEIRMSTNAEVVSGKLYLTKDADTIIYEKYDSNIRRRVNFTGHEIILQNVGEFTFTLLNSAVKVNVKDIWGNEYAVTAYSLINWNTVP
jgi:competence protein ComGF